MKATFVYQNTVDADGNPSGGFVVGTGLEIDWQDGPLGRGNDRKEPNGAFVETVLDACLKRLEFYQDSKFNCIENAKAILHIKETLAVLDERTQRREARGVEGTHAV